MMVVPLFWESQIRIQANWPMYIYEYKYINPEVFPKRVKVHGWYKNDDYFNIPLILVAYHDYDHDLIFKKNLIKNADDQRISEFLIESIVNFVKNG